MLTERIWDSHTCWFAQPDYVGVYGSESTAQIGTAKVHLGQREHVTRLKSYQQQYISDDQAITATADKSWHFHLGCFLEHYTGHHAIF